MAGIGATSGASTIALGVSAPVVYTNFAGIATLR
jgi:hypothetical protein